MILDIHTHKPAPQPEGVISLRIRAGEEPQPALAEGQLYSAGIHPWDSAEGDAFETVEALCSLPQVAAIGECGVDILRGGPMFMQLNLFRRHIELSERIGKPIVVHCVKGDDIICGLRRDLRPAMPWAIHGYRGKPTAAAQLVKSGCYISFGEHFNADTLRSVPEERILAETDESELSIEAIISRLSEAAGRDLRPAIAANTLRFLGR